METKYDPEDETLQLLRDLLPVEVRQPPAWSAGGKTRVVLVVAHCRAQGRAALIRVGTGSGHGVGAGFRQNAQHFSARS